MKWLEIIEFRTIDKNYELMKNELLSIIEKLNKEIDHQKVKLYVNVNLETDISIHIHHNTEEIKITGSELGLTIATNIKEFGLVNHYILKEVISNIKEESNE